MSLQHFFLKKQDVSNEIEASDNGAFVLDLCDQDIHHAKVLRLKPGEHIGVVDAKSNFFECEILEFDNHLIVRSCTKNTVKQNLQLWLCPGVSKANKLDDVIRACTEIGICGFIPTVFERSVVKIDNDKLNKRLERWNKIAKSAAMQSGQCFIPKIDFANNINSLCAKLDDFDFVFTCWELSNDSNCVQKICKELKNKFECPKIAIIVGPEGGISNEEIQLIKKINAKNEIISLGSSILRTETAGVVAPAIISFLMSC